MVFPVVMYGYKSWTVKKAEHWRIDAFEVWCWRRLLRVPWTARRSNQSILKEISPGCSLEGMMLKLKLQYFGYLMQSWLIGKDSDAGRDWGQEEKGRTGDEMAGWHHWLDGHEFESTPGDGGGQGGLVCCDSWGRKESETTERLNWTELNWMGQDAVILFFWMLSFKPALSLSSFTFIKRLFTFCHKKGVICISEVIDISLGNLYSSLCFIQPGFPYILL